MTIEEFISAVGVNNSTVEVDSDIDFNSWPFSASIKIGDKVIINGNGHTLTNIQQGNAVPFNLGSNMTINRLNFRNINLPTSKLFHSRDASIKILNECQISGIMLDVHDATTSSLNSLNFNRCSLNIERFETIRCNLTECYVVVGNNAKKGDATPNQYFGITTTNTYFKGKVYATTDYLNVNTNFINCCFNVDVEGSSYGINFTQQTSALITVVNSDKIEGELNLGSSMVSATDAEMHNAQALSDKGFLIYVP